MSRGLLALAMLALLGGGCATVKGAMDSLRGTAEPPAAAPDTADGKAAAYRAQAAQHERRGELRPAVEAWMTAVALTPDHEPSRVQLKRVRAQLDQELALRLQRGWQAVARDANTEARQEFVAALALDPYSKSAHEGLRSLAGGSAPDPRPTVTRPATPPPPARATTPSPERNGKPDVLYGVAKAHLAEGRDEEAYRALAHLERLNPGYADGPQLLSEVRQRLVRQRYQDGLKLFREERLEDAIEKWRGVLELDSRHPHARRNIEQAEKMLRTLAAQQKSSR
jgi:tetratricopeptide (TPR) repeat protein